MKKIISSLLLLATANIYAIMFDAETEKKMKKGNELFYFECVACEQLLDETFPLTTIAKATKDKFDALRPGTILYAASFEQSRTIATELLDIIENQTDYQEALQQAQAFDTSEAWSIVHAIVYKKARELIQEKSDLVFPSLLKDYTDMKLKLREFAQANKTIDPKKNGPYLEALSFVIYHIEYIKKESQTVED
ncbi:MAG: hypothetical protein AB7R69_03340 [Candidatus Babeliales bacterium]